MNLNSNLELNNDQRAFVNSAKQFANEFIIDKAIEWDKKGIFPKEVLKKSAEYGLSLIHI